MIADLKALVRGALNFGRALLRDLLCMSPNTRTYNQGKETALRHARYYTREQMITEATDPENDPQWTRGYLDGAEEAKAWRTGL